VAALSLSPAENPTKTPQPAFFNVPKRQHNASKPIPKTHLVKTIPKSITQISCRSSR
jgi:hypothetical protein